MLPNSRAKRNSSNGSTLRNSPISKLQPQSSEYSPRTRTSLSPPGKPPKQNPRAPRLPLPRVSVNHNRRLHNQHVQLEEPRANGKTTKSNEAMRVRDVVPNPKHPPGTTHPLNQSHRPRGDRRRRGRLAKPRKVGKHSQVFSMYVFFFDFFVFFLIENFKYTNLF